MRTYEITIKGKTPLIMHYDNLDWADYMEKWKNERGDKKGKSKAGDDRTPAWRWLGSLYHDGEHIALPSDNLSRCLMEAGAMIILEGKKTYKSVTQSGMMIGEPFWSFEVAGKKVPYEPFKQMINELDFEKHKELARQFGFELYVKRAKINQAKHVRVRPRFEQWSASGTVKVWDEKINLDVVTTLFDFAGNYKGLCDWRPGSRTPGSYGMFEATVLEQE